MNSLYINISNSNKDANIVISHNGFGSEYICKTKLIYSFVNFCLTKNESNYSEDMFNDYYCETCESSFGSLKDLQEHSFAYNNNDSISCIKDAPSIEDAIIKKLNNEKNKFTKKDNLKLNCEDVIVLADNMNSLNNACVKSIDLNNTNIFNENYNTHLNFDLSSEKDNVCLIKENSNSKCQKFLCQYCKKQFTTTSYLKCHLFYSHNHQYKKSPHLCTHCGKRYYYQSQLKYHLLCHENLPQFHCQICKKSYKTNQSLQRHMKCHMKVDYACNQCSKIFKIQNSLTEHILQKHSHDRPFECTQCSKFYATKSKLRKHRLQHLKPKLTNAQIRIFECSTCGRLCRDRHSLVAHQRIHSGERPFSCNYCGKSFTYKHHVAKHIKNMFCTKNERSQNWT